MIHKINLEFKYFIVIICFLLILARASGLGEVIWAVNCGGDAHTDIHGIRYQQDYLTLGIASDYGKNLQIQRIVPQDQILYQTERYHTSTFGYDIPIDEDGDYTLVLKFSEVWFTAMNQKVFTVRPLKLDDKVLVSTCMRFWSRIKKVCCSFLKKPRPTLKSLFPH
jgi:hypothetical protein